jgi:hypothetical protein
MDAAIAVCGKLGLPFTVDARTIDHAWCDLPNGRHLLRDIETLLSTTRRVGGAGG